jgi:hypothetical protein
MTGTPEADHNYMIKSNGLSVMTAMTILNTSNSKISVVIAYFNAMIVITSFTLVFIFKYMTKYQTQ